MREPEPPAEPVAFAGGCSFDPEAAGQVEPLSRPRSPDEHHAALRELHAWLAQREIVRDRAELDALPLPDEPEAEPEVRGAPRDPEQRAKYHKLLGAARKATSDRQRRLLLRMAAELEEYYPAGEALAERQPPPAGFRPRIVARASGGRSPAPAADQTALSLLPASPGLSPDSPQVAAFFADSTDHRFTPLSEPELPRVHQVGTPERAGMVERLRALQGQEVRRAA